MTSPQYRFKFFRLMTLLFLTLLLAACGGGGGGGSAPSTPTNQAPVVADVSGTVIEDTAKSVTLPGTDADGNALTYSVVTPPTHGAVTVSGGTATYTPTANYHGADSFTYKANDGTMDSAVATVSITVTPANDPPTASAATGTTNEDVAVTINLPATDIDGDTLTYSKVSDPAHGTVSISGNVATYTPAVDSYYLSSPDAQRLNAYFSVDSFTFKVSDGTAESSPATVEVTVNPVNDAPVAGGLGLGQTTNEDAPLSFDLPGYDPDQVSTALTATVTVQPQNGNVTVSGKQAAYTPNLNFNGNDGFKYTLSDGVLTSNEATVGIVVNAVSDPPTANAGEDLEATESTPVNLSGSASDPDGDTPTYSWAQTDSSGVTATLTGATTATPSFTAPAVTADTTLIFTLTVSDGNGGTTTDAVNVLVRNNPVVQPSPTDRLNDTGITTCGNDTQNEQPCPILSHPGQDGDVGRDVTDNDPGDGHAGFSFTKIGSDGTALPIQSEAYNASGTEAAGTKWSCVKDNVTGLIWEVKTDDGELHDKDDTYTWYEPDGTKNGEFAGYQKRSDYDASYNDAICYGHTAGNAATYCNTKAYVERVNAAGWCGATDWYLPSQEELRSIVSYDHYNSAIDTGWFPNTPSTVFWSSSPAATYNLSAWFVDFDLDSSLGHDGYDAKKYAFHVRLVRTGQ